MTVFLWWTCQNDEVDFRRFLPCVLRENDIQDIVKWLVISQTQILVTMHKSYEHF